MRDTLTKKIEKNQARIEDDTRHYIGASSIGSECLRQIWYQANGVKGLEIPAKTKRTWEIGKRLEGLIIDWLDEADISIGAFIHRTIKSNKVPKFQGHLDGVWIGTGGKYNAIIEIKTAKDASFKIFATKGVKTWNPQYYAQIQSYMGMSGIHKSYILVLNKDTSELSDELVLYDDDFYQKLEEKAQMIADSKIEPPKINGSPLFYKCKMCKFNKVCHI